MTVDEFKIAVGNALHEAFGPHPPEDRLSRVDALIDALAAVGLEIVPNNLTEYG